jgi:hypothetical protein
MAEVIRETIIRFNRETGWLATGVVGTVVFAALVLAVQEHQPNAQRAKRELSVKANPSPTAGVIAYSSTANAGLAPAQDGHVEPASAKTSLDGKASSSKNESAAPAVGVALNSEASHHEHRQNDARARGSRTANERTKSSVAFSTAEVKRRLIQLWHQSLAKSDKSRGWTAYSHLNKGAHKTAAYTAEMSH